ncbi:MAG: TonB-dependent receptor [Pseudomonadota bacterium]
MQTQKHPRALLMGMFAHLFSVLFLTQTTMTWAQSSPSPDEIFEFSISAQPLGDALNEFARITQRQVAANGTDISGFESRAVSGQLTAQAALQQILASTELNVVVVNEIDFAIRADSAQPTVGLSDSRNRVIDEIIVTGTKRNISLQKEQTSVAVVTEADIEEQVLFDVEDIILRTANVSTDSSGALNNLSIRGITLIGVGFTGTGATANVYVDGSPNSFNANQGAANLWDVAQVEILRGPQSTVQGRNALAGAVIINTADPGYEFGADARVLGGNENNRNYSGTLNIPLIDNRLAFRVSADYREIDFEIANLNTNNNTRFQEALTARAKLLWEPTDSMRIELGYQYVDTEFGEFNQVNAPGPVGTPEFDAFDPFGDVTFGQRERFEFNTVARYALDVTYDINDAWTLYGLATYEDSQRDTNFGALGVGDAPDETYTAEIRAAFDYGKLSGWIGAYYFDTEGSFQSVFSFPTAIFGIPSVPLDATVVFDTFQEDATENRAIFADVTYEFNETWSINVGARYDEEDFSDTGTTGSTIVNPPDCVFAPGVPGIGGLPCTALFPPTQDDPTTADFSAFLPRASVTYNFNELRSLSFTAARGYRAGGSYLRVVPGEAVQLLDFEPEFLTNYEFAFRSQWPEQDLTLNANLFFSEWEDQQVTIPGPTGAVFDMLILNVGSSEIYGLELELRKDLTDSLDMFATVGLVKTEFQDFPFAVDASGNPVNAENPIYANLAGSEFNSAPKTTLAIGLSWNAPSGFFASGNVSYASSQFSDVTNLEENKVGNYTLVNARAGYRHKNWSVAAFVDNLFDKRFVGRQGLSTVNTGSGISEPNMQPFFAINDPRVVGVEVRYSY